MQPAGIVISENVEQFKAADGSTHLIPIVNSNALAYLQHNYSDAELHNDDVVGEESIDYQDEDDAFNVVNNEDNEVVSS